MSNGLSNEVVLHSVCIYGSNYVHMYSECSKTSFESPFDMSSRSTRDVHKFHYESTYAVTYVFKNTFCQYIFKKYI